MFGMGFTEILIIAVIAILFLGPDKLPTAMVEVAKFFQNAKNAIVNVKSSIEDEMDIKDIKEEALAYKQELLNAGNKIKSATDVKQMAAKLTTLDDDKFIDDGFFDEKPEEKTKQENKAEEITLTKKRKSDKINNIKEDKTDV
ncbi:MAG: twin-arginine translocase subunit TatB [Sulfurimonas sp.]|nr:MAG: twin-arginine translocase subunit TatB [Sulfurimonas sp.]